MKLLKKCWWHRKNNITTLIVWIVLIVLDCLLILTQLLSPHDTLDIFLVFFVALSIFYIARIINMPKKLYDNAMQISPDQVETIAFGDIGFTVETKGTNIMEHKEIPYVRVNYAEFNDGWFFITVDKVFIHFFCASDFIGGTPDELMNILSSRLGSRFTVKM